MIEWNYDDFKYDMRKPQNGASGRIVAVINKYEIKRTTGLVEKTEVVNSKQKSGSRSVSRKNRSARLRAATLNSTSTKTRSY